MARAARSARQVALRRHRTATARSTRTIARSSAIRTRSSPPAGRTPSRGRASSSRALVDGTYGGQDPEPEPRIASRARARREHARDRYTTRGRRRTRTGKYAEHRRRRRLRSASDFTSDLLERRLVHAPSHRHARARRAGACCAALRQRRSRSTSRDRTCHVDATTRGFNPDVSSLGIGNAEPRHRHRRLSAGADVHVRHQPHVLSAGH